MITQAQARHFAEEWVAAWNAHDLERVLSHYTNDFEMSSPYISTFAGEPSGQLKGKDKVRAYWQTALIRVPDLRFELVDVFAGADSVAIYYNGALGKRVVEVFLFDQSGKVGKAFAHYD